ncbi:methyl-accepting chemotaxis protein [Pseudomonas sp. LPB0260]|uniref:methyl-accepting chemotaxis protein n=1 Tax=Pseudomonas sp. LPB0260 TaxID=2614442 RepID=UPI0015C2095E|nr:methyl-accepting chemotaxis protein [Pseudomonas sp. LPB0260]QLC72944.1 methyl-accepting chemotaxis protein [Pseudomonas sp. LPB0260]QLC75718.1 methyl-accepting chemotaxis protein [Pseudomonas sp. LPB0260]
MHLSLSWKHKFHILIAIALASLALMAASSFWASQRLNDSFHAREAATSYASDSFTLMNAWLKQGAMRKALSADNADDFQQRLAGLEQLAEQLLAQAQGLDQPALTESAQEVQALMHKEADLQRTWLALRQQLGLNPTEGVRQELSASGEALEDVSIGLIQPFIAAALSGQRNYLATADLTYARRTEAAIADMQAKIQELNWQENQIGQAVTKYAETFAQAHGLIQQIRGFDAQLEQLGQQIEQHADEQITLLEEGLLTSTARQAQEARSSSSLMMGITFAGVALFLLITLSQASRTLLSQLGTVTQLLTRVASGDLTGSMPVGRNSKDEFNQLGEATNRMIRGIGQIVGHVVDTNQQLGQLHSYLNDAMRHLGENSTQVEMQTEQTASASQQISATINEMAQRTSDVGTATQSAYDSARKGTAIIGASVERMGRLSKLIQATHTQVEQLNRASGKVAGIIDVINSLADQTNLLALNAAIEAARAGEAGRGFSVVADEVRTLAQKTVSATTDIARIVGDFKQQTRSMDELMTDGLALAAESEQHAGQVAEAIQDISCSMEQLTAEMNQVVVAIEEISCTTEDIADKMEEINLHVGGTKDLRLTLDQHTQGLSAQVEALSRSARQFRIA